MCEYVSFCVPRIKEEESYCLQIFTGNLCSHAGIEAGWNLKAGKYREAEWTKNDSGESLVVRVETNEKDSSYKAAILAEFPTRKKLIQSIKIGKADGNKYWYKKGELHRKDGPAVEHANGSKEWYKEGTLHREDGPAMEYANGDKEWWKEGKLHREDGPAVEFANGAKVWYKEGLCHREDGPAVECENGTKHWYKEGIRHREDGPAMEYANGDKYWYKKGKCVLV